MFLSFYHFIIFTVFIIFFITSIISCCLLSQNRRKCSSYHMQVITKTWLFKYIKNFTTKNWKFSDKNSDIFFYISAQNIDCGYSLEPPRRGGSNEYPQSMFLSRSKKNNIYPCKPQFYYIKVGFIKVNKDPNHFSIQRFFNPFMSSGLFYLNSLDRSISSTWGVWLVYIIVMFYRHPII